MFSIFTFTVLLFLWCNPVSASSECLVPLCSFSWSLFSLFPCSLCVRRLAEGEQWDFLGNLFVFLHFEDAVISCLLEIIMLKAWVLCGFIYSPCLFYICCGKPRERFVIRLHPLFYELERANNPYFHIILYLKNAKESTEKLLQIVKNSVQ